MNEAVLLILACGAMIALVDFILSLDYPSHQLDQISLPSKPANDPPVPSPLAGSLQLHTGTAAPSPQPSVVICSGSNKPSQQTGFISLHTKQ